MSKNVDADRRQFADPGVVLSDQHSPGGLMMLILFAAFILPLSGLCVLLIGLGNEQWPLVVLGILLFGGGAYVSRPSKILRVTNLQMLTQAPVADALHK